MRSISVRWLRSLVALSQALQFEFDASNGEQSKLLALVRPTTDGSQCQLLFCGFMRLMKIHSPTMRCTCAPLRRSINGFTFLFSAPALSGFSSTPFRARISNNNVVLH